MNVSNKGHNEGAAATRIHLQEEMFSQTALGYQDAKACTAPSHSTNIIAVLLGFNIRDVLW